MATPVDEICTEWSARVVTNNYELGKSYSVLLFLGTVPASPKEWPTSPSFAGAHSVFAGAKPKDNEDTLVQGTVSLTPVLRRAGLRSLDPADVVPHLRANLHWRVQKVVKNTDMSVLEVTVFSYTMKMTPFPEVIGDPVEYPECTEGSTGE